MTTRRTPASPLRRAARRTGSGERGVSMVLVLFILLSLTAMCVSALQLVLMDSRITSNDFASRYALYVAEAGLAQGIDVLRWQYDIFSPEGFNRTGLLDTGTWTQIVPQTAFGEGTYSVTVMDDRDASTDGKVDSNRTVLVRATGKGRGAIRVVEIALEAEEVL
jgi:hypothetical protein